MFYVQHYDEHGEHYSAHHFYGDYNELQSLYGFSAVDKVIRDQLKKLNFQYKDMDGYNVFNTVEINPVFLNYERMVSLLVVSMPWCCVGVIAPVE